MSTKSKLEQAVENQIANLNDAQRELVLSQFSIYKQNKAAIAEIDSKLPLLEPKYAHSIDEVKMQQTQRMSLTYERNQLATANSKIATELFALLSGGDEQ
jgi:hypothetical protein